MRSAWAGSYSREGTSILQEDQHLGVINGRLTCGVSKIYLGRINGIWAPPFISTDFTLRLRFDGAELPCTQFTWSPSGTIATGESERIRVKCLFNLVADRRSGFIQISVWSKTDADLPADVVVECRGTLDRSEQWGFAKPESHTATQPDAGEHTLLLRQGSDRIMIFSDELTGQGPQDLGLHAVLHPGKPTEFRVAFDIGPQEQDEATEARKVLNAALPDATRGLRFPSLKSDSAALDRLYDCSLLHLALNRWTVPEFLLHPYYSTGSINGGAICSYLWDFGENWEIMPLVDPAATKAHIRQFLKCDLTKHYAFTPITGQEIGPWYMVNQEKIIGLIYFYTLLTGDRKFLSERVGERSVGEWAVWHALYGDDISKPVALIDYGPANDHLELRREYKYNHVMPDLNGRRYDSYLRAAAIAEWAGIPQPDLKARAYELKNVLERELWDTRARWFSFVNEDHQRENRYTIQVFKLFGSGVLSNTATQGLLSHLNEQEFLSQYGLHSMSKLDPAYDQEDIDNGGGGSYIGFPPQIAERLYKAGLNTYADDILHRILWWGTRMPYWSDSIVANAMEYRKDTPLQAAISGAAVGQCIIFGIFGIQAMPDGGINITPKATSLFSSAELDGMEMLGRRFTVEMHPSSFTVRSGKSVETKPIGETIILRP